jgi:hypothetical protein
LQVLPLRPFAAGYKPDKNTSDTTFQNKMSMLPYGRQVRCERGPIAPSGGQESWRPAMKALLFPVAIFLGSGQKESAIWQRTKKASHGDRMRSLFVFVICFL